MSAAGLQECLQCLCWSSLSSQGPIVCYLCKEEIKAELWYSGDHRWPSDHHIIKSDSDPPAPGEAAPAGRQCSSRCCPLTRRWTAPTATGGWGCGQTRRWPSPATSASTRAPRAGTWSGHQTQRKVNKWLFLFPPRYHCFPCDYTLCSDCARNIEAILRGSRNRKPTENFVKIDQKLLVFQS